MLSKHAESVPRIAEALLLRTGILGRSQQYSFAASETPCFLASDADFRLDRASIETSQNERTAPENEALRPFWQSPQRAYRIQSTKRLEPQKERLQKEIQKPLKGTAEREKTKYITKYKKISRLVLTPLYV